MAAGLGILARILARILAPIIRLAPVGCRLGSLSAPADCTLWSSPLALVECVLFCTA